MFREMNQKADITVFIRTIVLRGAESYYSQSTPTLFVIDDRNNETIELVVRKGLRDKLFLNIFFVDLRLSIQPTPCTCITLFQTEFTREDVRPFSRQSLANLRRSKMGKDSIEVR